MNKTSISKRVSDEAFECLNAQVEENYVSTLGIMCGSQAAKRVVEKKHGFSLENCGTISKRQGIVKAKIEPQ